MVERAGRLTIPGTGRVLRYYTGLEKEVPDVLDIPDVGPMEHLNIAECEEGGDIQSAVANSIENLPSGVNLIVLLGSEPNPRTNKRIAVFITSD